MTEEHGTSSGAARSVEQELALLNVRRLRVFLPVMAVIHLAHVLALRAVDPSKALAEQRWQRGVWLVNATTLPVAIALALIVWRLPAKGADDVRAAHRRIADVVLVAYVLFGSSTTVFDQHISTSVHAFVLAALSTAFILRPSFGGAAFGYALGTAVVFVGARATQSSAAGLSSAYLGALTVAAVAFALSRTVARAAQREFDDRTTIEQQKRALEAQGAELRTLNAQLEQRVDDQVREIVARATEVEALNAQLAERVQERSRELSRALGRIAKENEARQLPEGAVLGGRVVILSLLGRGGMGAVYLGRDRVTDQRVAVKVLQAASAQELEELQRFLREAEATARVNHSAIVKSFAVDVSDDGQFFQILELVDGVTLAAVIDRLGPMPWTIAARLIAVVADALSTAHAANIVHRDVKPENIMLTRAGPGVKVLDFGIARVRAPTEQPELVATNPTRSGVLLGTPRYMAPEQIIDPSAVNDRTDVYALALVLYVAVSGRLPFDAPTMGEVFAAHAMAEPALLETKVSGVPSALSKLVHRCLAKSTHARPSAAELRDALAALADDAGVSRSWEAWSELVDRARTAESTPEATATVVAHVGG